MAAVLESFFCLVRSCKKTSKTPQKHQGCQNYLLFFSFLQGKNLVPLDAGSFIKYLREILRVLAATTIRSFQFRLLANARIFEIVPDVQGSRPLANFCFRQHIVREEQLCFSFTQAVENVIFDCISCIGCSQKQAQANFIGTSIWQARWKSWNNLAKNSIPVAKILLKISTFLLTNYGQLVFAFNSKISWLTRQNQNIGLTVVARFGWYRQFDYVRRDSPKLMTLSVVAVLSQSNKRIMAKLQALLVYPSRIAAFVSKRPKVLESSGLTTCLNFFR